MNSHQISEYIDNLPLKKVFCKGYRPDDVYEVVCTLSSMYSQLLSEVYEENELLKQRIEYMADKTLSNRLLIPNREMRELISDSQEPLLEQSREESAISETKQQEAVLDKDIQRLKRGELLEIMLEQSKENESLKVRLDEYERRNVELKSQLESRKIAIKEAGSIADASLKINGVYDAAQKAAQQYLDNLQDLYEQESAGFSQREAIVEAKCEAMVRAAKARCDEMISAAEEKCRALDQKAQEDVERRWDDLSKRLEMFYISREGMPELLTTT